MNRSRVQYREDVALAKRMFFIGCCFLPFLWLANVFYFQDVFKKPSADSAELRTWVQRSMVGAATVLSLLVVWIIVVQVGWEEWGWESLMISIPEEDQTGW